MKQYANSPIIQTRIANRASYFDPAAWEQQLYDVVLNIDTAQGFGLDIWGRIVGLANGRLLTIPTTGVQYLGFRQQNTVTEQVYYLTDAVLYNGEAVTQEVPQ